VVHRYQPHVDRNLTLARSPANLSDFTGYMNTVGMFVRGGDVWIQRARCVPSECQYNTGLKARYDRVSHLLDGQKMWGRLFNCWHL